MDDFSSWLAMIAAAALALAGFAWWRDHRRRHRSEPDAVGPVPWTSVFFFAMLVGVVSLSTAVKLWLAGG